MQAMIGRQVKRLSGAKPFWKNRTIAVIGSNREGIVVKCKRPFVGEERSVHDKNGCKGDQWKYNPQRILGGPGEKIFGFHYSNKDHELFLIISNFLVHHRPIHEHVHTCSLNECYDIFIIVFSPGGWCSKIVMLYSRLGALFVSLHI